MKVNFMLVQRTITGIVLSLLVIFCIFYLPTNWFEVISSSIVLFSAWEASSLFWNNRFNIRIIFLFSLLVIFLLFHFLFSETLLIIFGVFWWLFTPFLLSYYSKFQKPLLRNNMWKWMEGILIFLPCLSGILILRKYFGPSYLLYVLIIVWMTDIGAFFAGKFWGKHKLAEVISPKKTIEGLFGGIAAALVTATIGGILINSYSMKLIILLLLAFIVSLWSVIGDLYESMLKRIANVKDSGHILPGHGGIYDRIDSLTAAVPIFTLALFLFGP